MEPIAKLNEVAAKAALNGAKVPHKISHPVLRIEDQKICVSYLVYSFTKENLENNIYNQADEWLVLDVDTGELIHRYFCPICYPEPINMPFTDKHKMTPELYDRMCELIDKAREMVVNKGNIDLVAYREYMDILEDITPNLYWTDYLDLCNIDYMTTPENALDYVYPITPQQPHVAPDACKYSKPTYQY